MHFSSIKNITEYLETSDIFGLTDKEAYGRLKKYGFNEIKKKTGRSSLKIFLEQFKNLLVILLSVAAFLSLYLGSVRDFTVLISIVIINGLIGFYQDWKSEHVIASILKLIQKKCIVVRDGTRKEIPVSTLVKGDLVFLEEGDGVPADLRLVSSTGLSAVEFILTGESLPKDKTADLILNKESAISERANCLYMGTTISKGEGTGIVYATGMETEIGKIAAVSEEIVLEKSPLQREIDKLAYKITISVLILGSLIFLIRIFLNDPISEALIFAIGIAAAMVPEGLPAQISIALSIGIQRLAKRNAVVRRMSSVEALGAATVIASDKTGTITRNEMTISVLLSDGVQFEVTGSGFEPEGEIKIADKINGIQLSSFKLSFISGFLASTSRVNPPDKYHDSWYPVGDPTECAFATLSIKAGYDPDSLETDFIRVALFPFDSVRKRMSVIRKADKRYLSFVKGSIESILENSCFYSEHSKVSELSEIKKREIIGRAEKFAATGLRVIAFGYKEFLTTPSDQREAEADLIFLGFAGMEDPPHDGVSASVKAAFDAKIRVMMITGDNRVTAAAIGKAIGLINEDGSAPVIIDEKKLINMSDNEISDLLASRTLIFSRVSPQDKLRIVSLLKERGDIVAVTGDGVNDTLSLKKADIGVAMGLKGSEIAQEASAMILLDDNFSTIVEAIREGRTIYRNIQKNVMATLASNIAELTCVLLGFAGVFYGLPIAILAIHILLIDLIAEMLPLLALTIDPPHRNLMFSHPRKQGQMISNKVLLPVISSGITRGLIACWAFLMVYFQNAGNPLQHEISMTATMVTIIFTQFVNVFSLRVEGSVFSKYSLSNIYLYIGIGLSLLVMAVIVYVYPLNFFLHTAPLKLNDLRYPVSGALFFLLISEAYKYFRKKQ